jgi:hypothetical protein
MFLREEQPGATIEQQSRGFCEGDFGRLQMVAAIGEEAFVSNNPTVSGNKVIGEHGHRAVAQSRKSVDFEFDVNTRFRSSLLCEFAQRGRITTLVQEPVSSKEYVELQIIIGQAAANDFEHSAFTATITATKDESLQPLLWDSGADTFRDAFTDAGKVRFQTLAAIKGETLHSL